ncbi:UNVERIFIED_CONTAM: DNA-3-methyladenine glycosylase 1 [Sesamum latifolium]|uniref:DNA-3-methyladenine glycosylase 1 n=1 Tax=Sesamum latifolium TaxID=2727402 RepID=A0AAW2YDS8_9LAMI
MQRRDPKLLSKVVQMILVRRVRGDATGLRATVIKCTYNSMTNAGEYQFTMTSKLPQLFELLAMCGLLMDFNWTEILKRRQLLRQSFAGFDPKNVAKMGEKEIVEIASNKELTLAESRVAREYGSFGSYIWEYVSFKPMINKFRHPRNVPLRSPKAEAISKDLVRRGFRFVGPVIVYSFMQAAGMTIDHLVGCFRHKECVNLAERPWRHV